MKTKQNFAIDFDNTCVSQIKHPAVGPDVPEAVETMKDLIKAGHKMFLWTVRSDDALELAVEWFERNGIELAGINKKKGQRHYSTSPKIDADVFLDDKAFGCPLIQLDWMKKPCVDWKKVREVYLPDTVIKTPKSFLILSEEYLDRLEELGKIRLANAKQLDDITHEVDIIATIEDVEYIFSIQQLSTGNIITTFPIRAVQNV